MSFEAEKDFWISVDEAVQQSFDARAVELNIPAEINTTLRVEIVTAILRDTKSSASQLPICNHTPKESIFRLPGIHKTTTIKAKYYYWKLHGNHLKKLDEIYLKKDAIRGGLIPSHVNPEGGEKLFAVQVVQFNIGVQ